MTNNFIQELRNRRVFRAAAVYLGVGYAILEASSIIVPMMALPEIIVKIILGVLIIGFPLAIGLAWVFQVTPDGIRRSPKSGEKQSQDQKPFTGNVIIITLLTLILGFTAYPRFFGSNTSTISTDEAFDGLDPKSVAVLPFTSFTKSEEDESFADGVHDDILTQLSKVGDLKVISRTSMMQYKETTKPIPEIAAELGVVNLLEGSVRRAGDQIRIVAQLINAKSDEHLWAETFDREYADIFTVQTEVAKKIAKALKAQLTPQEEKYIEEKPTENQAAAQLYLRGQLLNTADVVDKDSVASIFDKATQLDPEFLLPYARLTRIHAYKYFDGGGTDPRPERLEMARAALEKALSIDPDAPETHLAQGYYHYYGSRSYNLALEEFSIAMEMQPNNSDLYAATAYVERRLGMYDSAMENLKKAVALDPINAAKVDDAGSWAYQMRLWDLGIQFFEQLSAIHSGQEPSVETVKYYMEMGRTGDMDKLQHIHDDLLKKFEPEELPGIIIRHATYKGDFRTALAVEQADTLSSFLDIGLLFQQLGQLDSAQLSFESARMDAELAIQENPVDWEAHGVMGVALAFLGRCEEAMEWGEKGAEMMPLSRDGLYGVTALEDMVLINMLCGDLDAAFDQLTDILTLPSYLNINTLRLDPLYRPLVEDPRFNTLIETQF